MSAMTWIKVDPDSLTPPNPEVINGIEVVVHFSPYDVPDAVAGGYDADRKRFVIRFRYIGAPEQLEHRAQGDIQLGIGKQTERLYEIEIDVDKKNATGVSLSFADEALKKLRERGNSRAAGNYLAASQALGQRRAQLTSALAGYP